MKLMDSNLGLRVLLLREGRVFERGLKTELWMIRDREEETQIEG